MQNHDTFVNKLLRKDGKITDISQKMRNMSIIWS